MLGFGSDLLFCLAQVSCLEELYQLDNQSFDIVPNLLLFHYGSSLYFLNPRAEQEY